MSVLFNTSQDIAHALANQHATLLAGEALSYAQAVHPNDASLDTEIAGVLQGCRMLGFLEHDAQCVAQAWQKQTQRIGEFSIAHWPCDPRDFGIAPLPRSNAFATCPHALGLYAVLPDAQWVGRMARAGVPTVQLRFKSNDATAIRHEIRASVPTRCSSSMIIGKLPSKKARTVSISVRKTCKMHRLNKYAQQD
jgi:thiamine-phosphate pyrophosphorylase